ncbi:histidine kinase [Maribacter sp. 2304DJ31-5]|uniref:histidine kinase n=1 Tax=Maribacter sp. 2304DJ31-5 TaxID=3386273 RepID=UPI0039BC70D4
MTVYRFLKELFRAFVVGTLVCIGFLIYFYFTDKIKYDYFIANPWWGYYQNIIFSVILYMVNAFWYFFLLRKYRTNIYTLKRMGIAISGNIVLTCVGVLFARIIIMVGFYDKSVWEVLVSQKIENYQQPILISLGISLIFYGIWYYRYRQEKKIKEQKIIAGTASAKFDALKNQLDPHFLFNSLNVLTSLIEEDPFQAQKFTTSLSKVYRYVLEQKNKDLVSVDEELQFARTYVKLLKMRFEDSVVLDLPEKSADPEAKIIPLSLQLLLENAIKHNTVTSAKPLHIHIYEDGEMLCITNNLQEKRVIKKSSGVGLQNIRQRYGILTDKEVVIDKTDESFMVCLPILTRQVSIMETSQTHIDDKRYQKAKERVAAVKGFYSNLIAFSIVIPCLAILNYNTTSFPWIIFPVLGWGFGLLTNGMEAFGYNPIWGKRWEDKKLRKLMEQEDF